MFRKLVGRVETQPSQYPNKLGWDSTCPTYLRNRPTYEGSAELRHACIKIVLAFIKLVRGCESLCGFARICALARMLECEFMYVVPHMGKAYAYLCPSSQPLTQPPHANNHILGRVRSFAKTHKLSQPRTSLMKVSTILMRACRS